MIRLFAVLVLSGISAQAQTITETFGTGANQFSIDFVEIGNPGSAGRANAYPSGLGSVNYVYSIGKYEISRDMITKFNSATGIGITMADMTNYGGNGANRPASGISWNEAARFVNYLNTSKGYQAAYKFTTSGANDNIDLWGSGEYNQNNPFRHKDAYYFLPSADEWFKAAYGSPSGTWYNYATGSTFPTRISGGTASGTAVYGGSSYGVFGPADITNAGGLSAWGTMGQDGNVWEWKESAWDFTNDSATELRELSGISFANDQGVGYAGNRNTKDPTNDLDENFTLGFRVASVPEPSSLSLLLAGGAVFAAARRRRLV